MHRTQDPRTRERLRALARHRRQLDRAIAELQKLLGTRDDLFNQVAAARELHTGLERFVRAPANDAARAA